MDFSPDSNRFASASEDETVKIWCTRDWQVTRSFASQNGLNSAVIFSHDGRFIAVAETDCVLIREVVTGNIVQRLGLPSSEFPAQKLRFNFDSSRLACVLAAEYTCDSQIIEWEVSKSQPRTQVSFREFVCSISFSPQGGLIASTYDADFGGRIYRLRDITAEKSLREIDLSKFSAGGVPLNSPDREVIVLGNRCYGSSVQAISAAGDLLFTVPAIPSSTPIVSFAGDTSMLAITQSGVDEASTRLALFAADGRLIREFAGASPVSQILFSRDGDLLIAMSAMRSSAGVWRVSDGTFLAKSAPHCRVGRISPDGRWFVSGHVSLRVSDLTGVAR